MHSYIEDFLGKFNLVLLEEEQYKKMAKEIIDNGFLGKLEEIWEWKRLTLSRKICWYSRFDWSL